MKDPDGVFDSVQEAAKQSVSNENTLSNEERDSIIESRQEQFAKLIDRWFEYGEYLTVEIDTEKGTCTVVK